MFVSTQSLFRGADNTPANIAAHFSKKSGTRNRLSSQLLLACALLSLLAVTGCHRPHFPHYPSNFREYAYVTNSGSNTVTVLDLVNLRRDRVLQVGEDPTGVAVNPEKKEAYVVNTGSGTVSVINSEANRVVDTIRVGRKPYLIRVNRTGTLAYVANSGSNDVSVIDLARRRVITTIPVGKGPGLAEISPDGNTLVVTNRVSGSVSVVDAKTNHVRATFSECPQATDAVILPNSSKAFVACSGGHRVMVLGLAQPKSAIPQQRVDRLLTFLEVGKTPVDIALKPDGGEIFVCNFGSDSISEIDTTTNEVADTFLIGAHPAYAIAGADNSLLWISNFNANTVGVYSIIDGQVLKPSVPVGAGPDALAFSSGDFLLLAVDSQSGDVAVIRTRSREPNGTIRIGSLFTMLPAGNKPSEIAVKAFKV